MALALSNLIVVGQDVASKPLSTAVEPVEHNTLHRPIALSDDNVHWVDRTYTYGSTQWQARPVHLGVEFVNPRGTAVYAAKAGLVVFAGSDSATLLGPELDYYGNVVILAHELLSLAGGQIFTLYGHLDEIHVAVGQRVDDLHAIGRVGSSGVAIGAHLHFEVRAQDPYDYQMTRNPELWLQHYVDHGMVAGTVSDGAGKPIHGKRLTLRSETVNRDIFSYGSDLVNGDPVWGENFAAGDVLAGDYEIIVLNESGNLAYQGAVTVKAYRTTFVEIQLDDA